MLNQDEVEHNNNKCVLPIIMYGMKESILPKYKLNMSLHEFRLLPVRLGSILERN